MKITKISQQLPDYYNNETARNPNTPPEVLTEILRRGIDDEVSRRAAQNPSTLPEALTEVLRRNKSNDVSCYAALNPNTPPEALAEVLRRGKDDEVSRRAARNLSTPPEILSEVLRRGRDDGISQYTAENPNTPPELLAEVLRRGKDDGVSRYAAANPNTLPEDLAEVLRRGKDDGVSICAVRNPNTPPEVLTEILRRGNNDKVSRSVVRNPNTPPEVIKVWRILIDKTLDFNKYLNDLIQSNTLNEIINTLKYIDLNKIDETIVENYIHTAFQNTDTRNELLINLPKTFFDKVAMTEENRKIVEEYYGKEKVINTPFFENMFAKEMKITKISQQLNLTDAITKPNIPVAKTYAVWLGQEILRITNNYQKANPFDESDLEMLTEWIEKTKPNVIGMPIEKAIKDASIWFSQSKYKTHKVVYKFKDGWEIVKLSEQDLDAENELLDGVIGQSREAREKIKKGEKALYSLRNPSNVPKALIDMFLKTPHDASIAEIVGHPDEPNPNYGYHNKPIPEYQQRIKEWFDSLKKRGYALIPEESFNDFSGGSKIKVGDLYGEDYSWQDDYGLELPGIYGIGSDPETYHQNLLDCYNEGASGSYWYESTSKKCVDNLITYASIHNELKDLRAAIEGYPAKKTIKTKENVTKQIDAFPSLTEEIDNWWFDYEGEIKFENPRPEDFPNKKDFVTPPDVSEQQPELKMKGLPKAKEKFDEEAYNKAVKEYQDAEAAYEEELTKHQEYFEPYVFINYVYKELDKAENRKKAEKIELDKKRKKLPSLATTMKTRIYKIAQQVKDSEIPKIDVLATYVESLKMYVKDHPNTDKKLTCAIEKLPSPRQITQDLSREEGIILYETINWVWKKITGKDIIEESKIIRAKESLFGNYWLIKNGILLHGLNHYGIIKQNAPLICSLLKINGFALQEYMASDPNKLIRFIIKNGGVRLFVNTNKKLYCQMSENTYAKWGKSKIKKYDFNDKIVKIIDFKTNYNGWKSGIGIKL